MSRIALLALIAVLSTAALAGAKGPGKGARAGNPAVAACKAERTVDSAAFQGKYANDKGKRAVKRCVRQHIKSARKTCKAERAADRQAFRAKYASKKGKRAMKRCVRDHAGDPA